ncbi:MAG: PleD family two-component system response regulator [Polyangiales bacterium]
MTGTKIDSGAEEPPQGAKPRVLIVDDDADILKMLRRYLGAKGLDVITTDAPFGVLELIREHEPHVVVLDLMIPGLDGGAIFGFIRAQASVAIVFYSASSEATLSELRDAHPHALVVAKASPLNELESAIRSFLP